MTITASHINHHHKVLLDQHLQQFLGDIEPTALALLHEKFQWLDVAGGEMLIEQGAPGDSMYISVSGRLRVYIDDEHGDAVPVRELGRGEVFGEMSLYTDSPRSASIVAIRDSVLVRLDKANFTELLAANHDLSIALTRQIIHRLQTQHNSNPMPLPVTITLVPISAGVDTLEIAENLAKQLRKQGSVSVIDYATVHKALNLTTEEQHQIDDIQLDRRMSIYLDNIESHSNFVLFIADDSPTNWTKRCARHGDELLLLADAQQAPKRHVTEIEYLDKLPLRTEAAEILILLHNENTQCPIGTKAWLDRRPVTSHIHIRPTLERDMARLARIETRTAVGLVLAGGGARGFAHLGIFKALKEYNIDIDFVGGTSMGAVMAALIAADQPLDKTFDICRESFLQNPTKGFNLIPFISIFSGRRLKKVLISTTKKLLGHSANIEDLWKNYYCVATNYSRASEQVLSQGSVLKSLRASTAIPGALPPILLDGDLLCDGATLNNFPVDIMHATRGVGKVIGVDLNVKTPSSLPFDEVPGTWTLLRDRLRKRHNRHYKLPSLSSYLMNVSVLYSMSRREEAKNLTDLYFNPPLKKVGLLDWSRFDQIVKQGYEHAIEVLRKQP